MRGTGVEYGIENVCDFLDPGSKLQSKSSKNLVSETSRKNLSVHDCAAPSAVAKVTSRPASQSIPLLLTISSLVSM